MSANPALVAVGSDRVPAPFPQEVFVLRRSGMQCQLDGVQTQAKGWNARGTMFLSNIRLVFVADKPEPSGLVAFDFPLVYVRNDKLNQPIFGCNNLSGQVWPAVEGGGPAGRLPPHNFTLYFKEGGIGTFYPLYYTIAQRAKAAFAEAERRAQAAAQQQWQPQQPNPPEYVQGLVAHAFVDPNDPSTIYLTAPTRPEQTLPEAPKYAANYGQDEKYEPMAPGH